MRAAAYASRAVALVALLLSSCAAPLLVEKSVDPLRLLGPGEPLTCAWTGRPQVLAPALLPAAEGRALAPLLERTTTLALGLGPRAGAGPAFDAVFLGSYPYRRAALALGGNSGLEAGGSGLLRRGAGHSRVAPRSFPGSCDHGTARAPSRAGQGARKRAPPAPLRLGGGSRPPPVDSGALQPSRIAAREVDIAEIAKSEILGQNPEAYEKFVAEGGKPRRASAEVALQLNPRPRMGDRVSYYVTARAKGQVSDWQRARAVPLYDPVRAPYDPDFYIKKLDDWVERYGAFLGALPPKPPSRLCRQTPSPRPRRT